MSSWEQLKERFTEFADLPPDERASYLKEVCADDPSLRAELLRLLGAEQQAGSFMDQPAIPGSAPTVSGSTAVFAPGDKLADRFRIIRFLDEGGMGQVYQAEDEVLGGFVALKTIRPEIASDRPTLERFKQEVRLAKEVTHENVCRVFDLDHHNVPPFVTMELVEGETLSHQLRRDGKMSASEAVPLIRQIARGLDAAHQKGIIHRDFKPGNVMLSRTASGDTLAKVTDFGLARSKEGDISVASGKALGTPGYMAPEQLSSGHVSVASDIYALGLVMYEIVTGTKPQFDRLTEPAPSPRVTAPELDGKWEAAILRCLERDPAKRFSRAIDIVEAIEGGPRRTQTVSQTGTSSAIYRNRRKLLAAAIATLALAGVLVLGRLAFQPLNTTVIVYPITNLTNTTAYEYLCKGTATELMRRLTQLDGIRVIPFPESRARGPLRLADASFALDGQLQEFHNQIRLTVQLTNQKDGTLVWSQKFEKELQNPLEMQSEIAQGTVDALEGQVFGAARGSRASHFPLALQFRRFFGMQLPRPPTTSNAAMEAYMRGRHLWDEQTLPATLSAIDYFHQAAEKDPNFALVYAALADTQFTLMQLNYKPQGELLRQAGEYAEHAVALGPDLAETYVSLAAVRQHGWDWRGADEAYRHAIRLNPKLVRAHWWYAGLILQFGRFDEAIKEVQEALKLDPYDYPLRSFYGMCLYYARQYQDAVKELESTLNEKDFINAHVIVGNVYAKLGSVSSGSASRSYFEKAFREASIVAEIERQPSRQAPSDETVLTYSDSMYATFDAMAGDKAAALAIVRRLEKQGGGMSPVALSQIYTALGEQDRALDLLEQAAADKDRMLLYVKVQPLFDELRSTKRFQDLLTRMGL